MLRRAVPLLLALGLTASACSGDPAAERARGPGRRADGRGHDPAHPGRAARPRRGLGADPARARAGGPAGGADAAARPRRPGDRGRVARHRGPGGDGPPAAPRRGDRVLRQRRVHRSDPVRQRDPGARRTTPVAAVPVRRPGGRHRRAGQGRRHPLPDLHVRRCRGRPAGDDGGLPRQRRGAARASASTWSSRRTPTSRPGRTTPPSARARRAPTPRWWATQVAAAVDGIEQAAVVPVLKHFPGHGSVPQDSHLTLPVQTRTRKQLAAVDLAPFAAAVEAGVPAVMVGHIDVRADRPAGALVDVAGGGDRGAARAARLRGAGGHRLAVDGGRPAAVRRRALGRAGPAGRQRRAADAALAGRGPGRDRARRAQPVGCRAAGSSRPRPG